MKKITTGFMVQDYNHEGECISQEFIAADEVEWENKNGFPVEAPGNAMYQPFDMVQPEKKKGDTKNVR